MKSHSEKILTPLQARAFRDQLLAEGKTLAFTNGCFDILHRGHVTYIEFARQQGDALCVGLNSDASVKRNKGESRPINNEEDRAYVASLMGSVVEPGKMANWIAPPPIGINRQAVDFDYVRFN
jgi:cytidyltransferase-like protein